MVSLTSTHTSASPASNEQSLFANTSFCPQPNFLGLCPEVRCLIYNYLFVQPNNKILAISRQPKHDYSKDPPDNWYADSLQEGLVYDSHTARIAPTNVSFLRTCRLINSEAHPIFYGVNNIIVYAEDNNDIFYWLLDIGERNRRAIRHLEISWAYGVSIQSGRENMHGILQNIEDMEHSKEGEAEMHRQQLIDVLKRLEAKTTRLSRMCPDSLVGPCLLTTHCSQLYEPSTSSSLTKASKVRPPTPNVLSTYPDPIPQLSRFICLALMVAISGTSPTQISTLPKNSFQTRPPMYMLASPKPWQKWSALSPSPLATPKTSNSLSRLPEPQERKNSSSKRGRRVTR